MSEMGLIEYFICGGFGGIALVLVGHPLDTIKVRLQVMPACKVTEKPMYSGTMDCCQKIIQHEGFRGLYKGMMVPLVCVAPIFAVSFMSYGIGKRIFDLPPGQQITYFPSFIAGGCSGLFTTIITVPAERIKCLLQIQQGTGSPKLYDGPWDCAMKLYKEGGVASLYRGSIATVLRDVPATGIYFLTYEAIKTSITNNGKEQPTVVGTMVAGGTAGLFGGFIGMPADVLKSCLQTVSDSTHPERLRSVFYQIIKTEGPRGLYKGFSSVLLRVFPANAACFVGFELSKRMWDYLFKT